MKRLVGLSVSFCVKAICEGKVALADVAFIVPGMVLNDENTIWNVYERYKDIYWSKYPEQARRVLEQLEIRVHPGERPNIAAGCWILASDYTPDLDLQQSEHLKHHTHDLEGLLNE